MNGASIGLVVAAAVVTPWGCASSKQPTASPASAAVESARDDIDTAKAFLPLSRIEPPVVRPERPAALSPVSERAAKQISAATKLVGEQRYTEAAIELERALRYDPDHPDIHRTLAVLHWEAGNVERAKTHVARALAGNPDDTSAQYIDGRCKLRDGTKVAAMTAFRTALLCSNLEQDPGVEALCHFHLAQTAAKEGYVEAALSAYAGFDAIVNRTPMPFSRPELAALAASGFRTEAEAKSELLEKLGRFSPAADVIAPFVGAGESDAALSLRYARLLKRAGRLEDALAAARRIPSNDVDVTELLLEIHTSAGHPERILDDLRDRMARGPDQSEPVLRLADTLVRLRRETEARQELQAYLQSHADDAAVRLRLIDLHLAERAWEEALQTAAAGMHHQPSRETDFADRIRVLATDSEAPGRLLTSAPDEESFEAGYLRGLLASVAGQPDVAERFLRKSYTQNPESACVREALGRQYFRSYRYDQALEVAGRRQADIPEDARLEMLLGDVHERLDDVQKAELHYKARAQLTRTGTAAMLALARLYNQSGRRFLAQRQLQELLEKDPAHEAARELLAFTYFDENKPDVAIQQLEELSRRAVTPILKARCEALLQQVHERDAEAYRRLLNEAIAAHGADAATWMAIAESYNAEREPEKRRDAYVEVLRLDAEHEDAAMGLVACSQRLLGFEEAAERLRALLLRRPNRHPWRLALVDLLWTLQDYDAAIPPCQAGAERTDIEETWQRSYRLAWVETLRLAGRREEVLLLLGRWAANEPKDAEWSDQLAREYLRQGQPLAAIPIYEAKLQASPDDRDVLVRLIGALTEAKAYDQASQHLLDWLNDDPENDQAIARLASVLAEAGQHDQSLELIHNRLVQTAKREEFQDQAIRVLAQAKRFDRCIEWIEGLLDEVQALSFGHADRSPSAPPGRDERPDEPAIPAEQLGRMPNEPFRPDGLGRRQVGLRVALVATLMLAKDYRSAQAKLTEWSEAARQNPLERFEYVMRLAFCHRRLGDEEGASGLLEGALTLRPGEITLNNDVAYGWIDRGIRLDQAERMIRYALFQRPRQAAFLDTYGWFHYKRGDFAEAKKWLLRAARARDQVDAVIHDHLGDTFWRLGDSAEAMRYWTESVDAIGKQDPAELDSGDEQRVRNVTPGKLEEARAGRVPAVAPLAEENTGRRASGSPDG